MSDEPIVVTGGGSVSVATDDQLDRVQRLEAFVETARGVVAEAAALNAGLTEGELRFADAPPAAFEAKRQLGCAVALLTRAADEAALVARLTRLAMHNYGVTEHDLGAGIRSVGATMGTIVGALAGLGVLVAGGVAIAGMGTISPDPGGGGAPRGVLKYISDHPTLINNPVVVGAARLIVDSMDDAMLASGHLPTAVIDELRARGLTGPELAAAVLIATGAPIGKLVDSSAAIANRTTRTGPGAPPLGWADRIARIPDTAHNGGYQIRIDKFVDANGRRSFEVYLSGTQTFSTSKTSTPFDMTSNVKGIAGESNASLAAVEKAMRESGIRPGDPVNITGHSQGGLLAHEVAATGRWNIEVALEAGPPASQSSLPSGTTELIIAHNEDVVTALGGSRPDDSAIVVHATAFPDGHVPAGESTPPAHDTHRYEHTARVLDGAASSVVDAARVKADASERGATSTMTTTLYRAERVWGG